MVVKTPKKKKYKKDVGELDGERITMKKLEDPKKLRRKTRDFLRFVDDLSEGVI